MFVIIFHGYTVFMNFIQTHIVCIYYYNSNVYQNLGKKMYTKSNVEKTIRNMHLYIQLCIHLQIHTINDKKLL